MHSSKSQIHFLLEEASSLAAEYLDSVPNRFVAARATAGQLLNSFGGELPMEGTEPLKVLRQIAKDAEPGLIASSSPRYFGFVIGGTQPVSIAADWLVSAWDQNAAMYSCSPACAVIEQVTAGWLKELFGLRSDMSVGFVTGAQIANFTGLAAARYAVLKRVGWDVHKDGLQGAPLINVIVSAQAHATVHRALRFLGFGQSQLIRIPTDSQGRMDADALDQVWHSLSGPTIVCAQVGNLDTGSCDPIRKITELAKPKGAWVHVDGAFGLWAATSPKTRSLVDGIDCADSLATDAHKWLNTPYECGMVFVADRDAHMSAMSINAAYLVKNEGYERDATNFVPELSRRARGVPLYAAIKTLGREGICEIVERCCDAAAHMAKLLACHDEIQVLNDVVLNQVLLAVNTDDQESVTRAIIARIQNSGVCWIGGTTWQGNPAIRISVSNWQTSFEDIERSASCIIDAVRCELDVQCSGVK